MNLGIAVAPIQKKEMDEKRSVCWIQDLMITNLIPLFGETKVVVITNTLLNSEITTVWLQNASLWTGLMI